MTFVSLQHEVRDEDSGVLQELAAVHVLDRLRDFADTAAVVALLDAVISADTAVAHLAGAMGKPLFCCCRSAPISAGCASARTARGIRPRDCSVSRDSAIGQA